jgi:hypothetical protein
MANSIVEVLAKRIGPLLHIFVAFFSPRSTGANKAWWCSFFFHGIMFPYYHPRPLLSVTTFVFANFRAFFLGASLLVHYF